MKKIMFAIALCFALHTVAYAAPNGRVINGSASSISQWPWMASLSEVGSDPRQGHFCGGVLIDSTHVLTAAHCVVDFTENPEAIQVTLGRTRLSEQSGITVSSQGIVVHPDYLPEQSINDIAIIRVEETGMTEFVSPVSFAEPEAWDADSVGTVIGWGFVDTQYPIRPDTLQEANIPIVSSESCSDRIGIDFDSNSMICAGKLATGPTANDGVDACNGDSGGPLVVYTDQGYKLAGLVSWGYACGSDRYWGVYTKVAQFHDWIASRPKVLPYAKSVPTIRGRPEINNTLTCQKGEWGSEGPLTFTYQWHDAQEGLIKESRKPSYRLKRNDIGRSLRCTVVAHSDSGETAVDSGETGLIFPATKRVAAKGRTRGMAGKIGVSCEKSQCSYLLSFGKVSVKSVSAFARNGNSIAAARTIRARQVTADSWVLRVPRTGSTAGIFLRVVFHNKPSQLIEL